MPFDVIAWGEATPGTGTQGIAGAGGDQVYETNGDNIRIKERARNLIGLFYGALTTPGFAQLVQPSLKTNHQFIQAVDLNGVDPRGGVSDLLGRPLPLKGKEWCLAQANNASDEDQIIAAFLADKKFSQAILDSVLPTHRIRGIADQAVTAHTWTYAAVVWDQDLPEGTYYPVGMRAFTYKAATPTVAAVRLLCQNSMEWRPGVIAGIGAGDKVQNVAVTEQPLTKWPLMPEVSFTESFMPNIEVMCAVANTDHVVELLLVGPKHF